MGHVRSKPDKVSGFLPVPPPAPARAAPRLPSNLAGHAMPEREIRGTAAHQFDKAFPVLVRSERGLANGVGRNISSHGMFVETREPCTIGTEVRVTFAADSVGAEITAIGEVRFQCFLNFSGEAGRQEGMRGMGIRFVRFEESEAAARVQPVSQ
jgi:hypothetical protein